MRNLIVAIFVFTVSFNNVNECAKALKDNAKRHSVWREMNTGVYLDICADLESNQASKL